MPGRCRCENANLSFCVVRKGNRRILLRHSSSQKKDRYLARQQLRRHLLSIGLKSTLDCTFKSTLGVFMSRVRVNEDIRPLSEFRAGVASFIKQLQETRRPMILTQRGRGVAVLVGVHEYEKMQERLEMLEEIYRAEEQIAAGEGIAHEDAKARVLGGLVQ